MNGIGILFPARNESIPLVFGRLKVVYPCQLSVSKHTRTRVAQVLGRTTNDQQIVTRLGDRRSSGSPHLAGFPEVYPQNMSVPRPRTIDSIHEFADNVISIGLRQKRYEWTGKFYLGSAKRPASTYSARMP